MDDILKADIVIEILSSYKEKLEIGYTRNSIRIKIKGYFPIYFQFNDGLLMIFNSHLIAGNLSMSDPDFFNKATKTAESALFPL